MGLGLAVTQQSAALQTQGRFLTSPVKQLKQWCGEGPEAAAAASSCVWRDRCQCCDKLLLGKSWQGHQQRKCKSKRFGAALFDWHLQKSSCRGKSCALHPGVPLPRLSATAHTYRHNRALCSKQGANENRFILLSPSHFKYLFELCVFIASLNTTDLYSSLQITSSICLSCVFLLPSLIQQIYTLHSSSFQISMSCGFFIASINTTDLYSSPQVISDIYLSCVVLLPPLIE